MQELITEIQKMSAELDNLKRKLEEYETSRYFENWIPRKKLMEFFDYEDTKIAALLKQAGLVVSQIGNRKFVKKESIIRLLEKNVNKP